MSYDALFSPIKLRGLELKNRVVLPGMNTKMVKDKNDVGEDLPAYHAARAAGGCGLNIVELVSICPECHAYLYLGLYNEHHRDQLRKVTDAIHAAGGKAGVQIWHGGFVPEEFFDKSNKLETPDTLTVERIHEIVKQFGYSAKLAVEAGFDALEFHGAHTYLPHEFMNPSLNKRTDEYGNQSLENRCRFNLEVIREMRKNMPEDMPLLMRLDAIDEMLPAVTTQDETVQFINWAAEAGVDAIDLSVVAQEPEGTYGYKITQQVTHTLELSESTLYPVLRRLQKDQLLTVYDAPFNGRNRRYYQITTAGRQQLAAYAQEWSRYRSSIDTFFREVE